MKKLTTYLLSTGMIFAAAAAMSVAASADASNPTAAEEAQGTYKPVQVSPAFQEVTWTETQGTGDNAKDVEKKGKVAGYDTVADALNAISKAKGTAAYTLTLTVANNGDATDTKVFDAGAKVATPKDAKSITITKPSSVTDEVTLDASAAKSIAANCNLILDGITLNGGGAAKVTAKGDVTLKNGAKITDLASIKGAKDKTFTFDADQVINYDFAGFGTVKVPASKNLHLIGGTKKGPTFLALDIAEGGAVYMYDKAATVSTLSGKGTINYVQTNITSSDGTETTNPAAITLKASIKNAQNALGYVTKTATADTAGADGFSWATTTTGVTTTPTSFPSDTPVKVFVNSAKEGDISKITVAAASLTNNGVTNTLSATKKDIYVRPIIFETNVPKLATAATWDEVLTAMNANNKAADYVITLNGDADIGGAMKFPKTYKSITIRSGLDGNEVAKTLEELFPNYDNYFKKTVGTTTTYYVAGAGTDEAIYNYTELEGTTTYTGILDGEAKTYNSSDGYDEDGALNELASDGSKGEAVSNEDIITALKAAVGSDNFAAAYIVSGGSKAGEYLVVNKGSGKVIYAALVSISSDTAYAKKGGATATNTLADAAQTTPSAEGITLASGVTGTLFKAGGKYYIGEDAGTKTTYSAYPIEVVDGIAKLGTAVSIAATDNGSEVTYADDYAEAEADEEITVVEVPKTQLAFTGALSASSATGSLNLSNLILKSYKLDKKSGAKNGVSTSITSKGGLTLNNVLVDEGTYAVTANSTTTVYKGKDLEDASKTALIWKDTTKKDELKDGVEQTETATSIKSVSAGTLTLDGEVTAVKVAATTLVTDGGTINANSIAIKGAAKGATGTGAVTINPRDSKDPAQELSNLSKFKVTMGTKNVTISDYVTGAGTADAVTYKYVYSGKNLILKDASTGYVGLKAVSEVPANAAATPYASAFTTAANNYSDDTATLFADMKSITTYLTNAAKADAKSAKNTYMIYLQSAPAKFELPKAGTYKALVIDGELQHDDSDTTDLTSKTLPIEISAKSLKLTGALTTTTNIKLTADKVTAGSYKWADLYAAQQTALAQDAYDAAVAAVTSIADGTSGKTISDLAALTGLKTKLDAVEKVAEDYEYLDTTKGTAKASKAIYDKIAAGYEFCNSYKAALANEAITTNEEISTAWKALGDQGQYYVYGGTYTEATKTYTPKMKLVEGKKGEDKAWQLVEKEYTVTAAMSATAGSEDTIVVSATPADGSAAAVATTDYTAKNVTFTSATPANITVTSAGKLAKVGDNPSTATTKTSVITITYGVKWSVQYTATATYTPGDAGSETNGTWAYTLTAVQSGS